MNLKLGNKVRLKGDSRRLIGKIVRVFDNDYLTKDKFGYIEYLTMKGQFQVKFDNYCDTLSRSQIEKID